MKRAFVVVVLLVVIAGVAGGSWWYVNQNPAWWFWLQDEFGRAVGELGLEPAEEVEGLVASGFIEAEEASVTTELGGRIMALHVGEGDEVEEGEAVVALDDSLLLAQVQMAEADVGVVEATLAQVKAGVRQEKLEHALAMLGQAEAAREAARVGWEDARAMLENPQELELALTAARGQLGVVDLQGKQAEAMAKSAQVGRELADELVRMLEEFEPFNVAIGGSEFRVKRPGDAMATARHEQAVATYQSWEAWTGVGQAEAAQRGVEQVLAELRRQRANPLALQAAENAAESQYEIASAAVGLAEAQVEGLQMGATPEQIAAVEAQVELARAALAVLAVQEEKLTLTAPISGLVLERPVQVGEVAMPGAPLLTLADLDNVTLTIYVPEGELGQVQLGQAVSVTVDAYAERVFEGHVSHIASEAEFTPKNVQTREERVNMVFAVKVKLANGDHALKPGMPADAMLVSDER